MGEEEKKTKKKKKSSSEKLMEKIQGIAKEIAKENDDHRKRLADLNDKRNDLLREYKQLRNQGG